MNGRSARKQILIAECELNRSQVVNECALFAANVHKIGARAEKFRSFASSAALLVTGFAAFQKGGRNKEPGAGKASWGRTLLKGAGLVSTVWLALQPPQRNR